MSNDCNQDGRLHFGVDIPQTYVLEDILPPELIEHHSTGVLKWNTMTVNELQSD